jgi:DNA-binding transcriptional ArsR family regulator
MESSFAIIAEPNRRSILGLLAVSERTVGELERRLRMPQTSVS